MNGFTVLDTVTLEERYIFSSFKDSLIFFHSESPVSVSLEDYKRIWPYTSNIWTTAGKGYTSVKNIQTQKYNCRCNNNKKQSKNANKENENTDASKKKRMTKVTSYK
jgi:hypothetical protein